MKNENRSIIGSLLSEISWEGKTVNKYRNGGEGLENVLTTEVLQILYFLPRTHFLGEIIKNLHMNNTKPLNILYDEIEKSEFDLFPTNYYLKNMSTKHQNGISVQPDALLVSQSIYSLVELKRIKRSSFQKEQLAREFYLCTRESKNRIPLLILIISKEPPVSVAGEGRVNPIEYIKLTLPKVYEASNSHHLSLNEVVGLVDNHVAWITWDEISQIIEKQQNNYHKGNESERACIQRLCEALIKAIQRHS
jgi:hypothetical protein